jgi:putative ABC transport system permease protein
VAALVGVIVSLPLAVRPLAALIAAPMRLRGMPGELAKQNAMRNPRRTSSTAAALMVGLTLVVSMSVFASSLKESFGEVIGDKTSADLFVARSSAQGPGFSPDGHRRGRRRSRRRPGLRQRLGTRLTSTGQDSTYSSVNPANAEELMSLDVSQGSMADLGRNGRRGLQGNGDGERMGDR